MRPGDVHDSSNATDSVSCCNVPPVVHSCEDTPFDTKPLTELSPTISFGARDITVGPVQLLDLVGKRRAQCHRAEDKYAGGGEKNGDGQRWMRERGRVGDVTRRTMLG